MKGEYAMSRLELLKLILKLLDYITCCEMATRYKGQDRLNIEGLTRIIVSEKEKEDQAIRRENK